MVNFCPIMAYSYSNFLEDCEIFTKRSDKLRDGWAMVDFDDIKFLSKKIFRSFHQKQVSIEYHVIYDRSYNVPVLYFSPTYSSGGLVRPEHCYAMLDISKDQVDVISQTDHPLLDSPFYFIHPCQTSKMMSHFSRDLPKFVYLVTFLSTMGPIAGLFIPHTYTFDS